MLVAENGRWEQHLDATACNSTAYARSDVFFVGVLCGNRHTLWSATRISINSAGQKQRRKDMAIDLGNGKNILSMTLVDMSSGKEKTLLERQGSRCHFYEDIYFEGHIITLRVDWGDIRNTDPVLDADIYQDISGRKGKKLRNGSWHHTLKESNANENRKIYHFSFNHLRLRLGAKMSFSLSVSMDAIIVKEGHDEPGA